jgi:hypothetical protein
MPLSHSCGSRASRTRRAAGRWYTPLAVSWVRSLGLRRGQRIDLSKSFTGRWAVAAGLMRCDAMETGRWRWAVQGDEATRQTRSLFFDEKGNHAAYLSCSPFFRSCAGEMLELSCMRGVVHAACMDSLACERLTGYTERLHACIGGVWRGPFTVQYNNKEYTYPSTSNTSPRNSQSD